MRIKLSISVRSPQRHLQDSENLSCHLDGKNVRPALGQRLLASHGPRLSNIDHQRKLASSRHQIQDGPRAQGTRRSIKNISQRTCQPSWSTTITRRTGRHRNEPRRPFSALTARRSRPRCSASRQVCPHVRSSTGLIAYDAVPDGKLQRPLASAHIYMRSVFREVLKSMGSLLRKKTVTAKLF